MLGKKCLASGWIYEFEAQEYIRGLHLGLFALHYVGDNVIDAGFLRQFVNRPSFQGQFGNNNKLPP